MTWLLGNGRMITRDPENPYYENGCLCIEGNKALKTKISGSRIC